MRDQLLLSGGLLEVGVGWQHFRFEERAQGISPYQVFPGGTAGNFFRDSRDQYRRLQWFSHFTFTPLRWAGRHEIKIGGDVHRVSFRRLADRRPIFVFRADGTRSREVFFSDSHKDEVAHGGA